MKTIYTSLPIYDRIEKQCYERGKRGGMNTPTPIICPRHRLPSFQWNAEADSMDNVYKVEMITLTGGTTNITSYFVALPTNHTVGTDVYYYYNGATLKYLLAAGTYYLKIYMDDDDFILYSDWFKVDCVYQNLITAWTNDDYNTFVASGTALTSIIETSMDGKCNSGNFTLITGENIKVIFFLATTSGQLPTLQLTYPGGTDFSATAAGLNEITLTAGAVGTSYVSFLNTLNANWNVTEVIVIRDFSEKYLTLNFHNSCDLGEILYHIGFTQTLWFESETMEQTYPLEEEGVKNGFGQFVRSFGRQVKKYLARTKAMPDYMVDVFHRLKLHDDIELIDLVGNVNDVYNLEVEHEWLFDDKYYAKMDLTFDYDETVVIGGCCNNI